MADRITCRWIEYFAPGLFTADTWAVAVDAVPKPEDVPWPDNAYAFSLYERDDLVDGPETFTGKARRVGPMYYHPDSRIETLEEVKKNPKATRILISNMEGNRWDRVVWTRWGNWPQPADEHIAIVGADHG